MRISRCPQKRPGFVLLSVLIVVTLLALAAYQFSDFMSGESRAALNTLRSAQTKELAESGIHYAAAVLSDPEQFETLLARNPYDNPGVFQQVVVQPSVNGSSEGMFSIFAINEDEFTANYIPFRYGVSDESGKINLNTLIEADPSGEVALEILLSLPGMTDAIANAILDWIDEDEEIRPNGAESQSYSGRLPPYRAKNGRLNTLEELLLVRGMTPELLFGNDFDRNGESDDPATILQGWSRYLTVYSRELNRASNDAERIFLNSSNLRELQEQLEPILGPEVTNYLLAYRLYGPAESGGEGENRAVQGSPDGLAAAVTSRLGQTRGLRSLSSLFELVDTQVEIPGRGDEAPPQRFGSPLSTGAESLRTNLPLVFDQCTTRQAAEIPARINVNTAPRAVLEALPVFRDQPELVQSILDQRPPLDSIDAPDPIYDTLAWLVTDAGVDARTAQSLERYITARSQVYRFQSVGFFRQPGPATRIEAVIDTNQGNPRIVYWRDLSELGPGFPIRE